VPTPVRRLQGFERIPFAAGQTRTVTFAIPATSLGYWSVAAQAMVREPGRYEFLIGPSSTRSAVSATLDLPAQTTIASEAVPTYAASAPTKASNMPGSYEPPA
jgi:hypothetical protein